MKHRENMLRQFVWGITLSLLVGTFVIPLAICVAWQVTYRNEGLRPEQGFTQILLTSILPVAISDYQSKYGSYPTSLSDLTAPDQVYIAWNGQWEDGWGRRLIAEFDGSQLIVTSQGRDGKPGGKGLDHDLSNLDAYPLGAAMTLGQYLTQSATQRIQLWCVAAGVLTAAVTFIIVFMGMNVPKLAASRIVTITYLLLMLCAFSILVAGVISALHVPMPTYYMSGH